MMREILFRGKRKDNGDWVFGDVSFHKDGRVYIRCWDRLEYCPTYNAYEVDPATVGQFTGLTNGKKIFEGDIVRDSNNFVGIVEFGTGTFDSGVYCYTGWHRRERDGCVDHTELHDYGWPKEFEVIGNIHDNPELLGGVEDG